MMNEISPIETPRVDAKGVAHQQHFNEVDKALTEAREKGNLVAIGTDHFVWYVIHNRWARKPEPEYQFWAVTDYTGEDGKAYDVAREPTTGELDLLLKLLAVKKFLDE